MASSSVTAWCGLRDSSGVTQPHAAGADRLVQRTHDQRQAGVARHPVAEGDHLGKILLGVDVQQRHRRALGEERLLREAQHDRRILAAGHNKAVPLEVLSVLSGDSEVDVRAAVADKRKLSVELFRRLAADPDDGVRTRVAYNRKTPVDLLRALVNDPADLVRDAARAALARRADQ